MRVVFVTLAVIVLVTGCSGLKKSIDNINRSDSASGGLQSYIGNELATKFHRQVTSVSCTPYVDEVVQDSSANVSCVVRFADGSSYTTSATITDPATVDQVAYYTYSFTDPPALDITTAPLPRPVVTLAATNSSSLFRQNNLAMVIKKLTSRFGTSDLFVQLALYPGELVAVIAGNGGVAWPVSVTDTGAMTVGPQADFDGTRSGIDFSQFVPGVIEQLTELIVAKGGVPLSAIARFVLTNSLPDQNSGWNIYLTSGTTRFQALVLGEDPVKITPDGTHPVGRGLRNSRAAARPGWRTGQARFPSLSSVGKLDKAECFSGGVAGDQGTHPVIGRDRDRYGPGWE
jgi:hypothetical protein